MQKVIAATKKKQKELDAQNAIQAVADKAQLIDPSPFDYSTAKQGLS